MKRNRPQHPEGSRLPTDCFGKTDTKPTGNRYDLRVRSPSRARARHAVSHFEIMHPGPGLQHHACATVAQWQRGLKPRPCLADCRAHAIAPHLVEDLTDEVWTRTGLANETLSREGQNHALRP
nr:hypothetical protein [Chthonomonas sp.]